MGRIETFKADARVRRQAELQKAASDLVDLNRRLGIQSTLQTTMPTTGVGAFIGVATGYAIVPINHLENLADGIHTARQLAEDVAAVHDDLAQRNAFLEAELERWHRIDGQATL
jgi:hypothetical protein